MNDPVLKIQGLRTVIDSRDGPVRAVDGVDLEIERGKTFAVLGESGCGKSMTAFSIMRLLPPGGRVVDGTVRLHDTDLLRLSEVAMRGVRGGRIAMIFQEPQTSLNPVLSVGEQVAEAVRRHRRLGAREARETAVALLDQVGIPEPGRRVTEFPHQLSGGMKQRVMIAMALAGEPELLIADEPTTALDVTIQAQVLDLLRRLQGEMGMAILLITHDLGVVAEMADRVAVMYAGEMVETGHAKAFFAQPLHPYSRKLFAALPDVQGRDRPLASIPGTVPPLTREFSGCRFADRCDRAWTACIGRLPQWHRDGEARVRCHLYAEGERPAAPVIDRLSAADESPAPEARAHESLLTVAGLQVHFPIQRGVLRRTVGHVRAVDGLDLEIGVGRTVALVGESGCGKTTAGKALLQLIRPTAGSVRFAGEELTSLSGSMMRRRRRDLQVIFQDPYASMNPRMRVAQIVEEGLRAQRIGERSARAERVEALLQRVGLDAAAKRRFPHEFSGGQRQRICIARALAVDPKLVICDEPTSALDVSVQAQILNLLSELQRDLGLSYLFITHNISVVEYLAHEVEVMYLGRIVERGPTTRLLNDPKHPYTQALLSAVPVPDPEARRTVIRLEGDMPSPSKPPAGCHFHPRCPRAMARCRRSYPGTADFGGGHSAACFLYDQAL